MIPVMIFKRQINVCCWRVVGDISKAQRREEMIPLLIGVRELREDKKQAKNDARALASHLFFESSSRQVVAERMLHSAAHCGLLAETGNGHFTLTEEGNKAIETGEVFVPQYGAWTVWASNDPLLESNILHVEPWEDPRANDDVWKPKDKPERQFTDLPRYLLDTVSQIQKPCTSSAQRLRVEKFEARGESVSEQQALSLEWSISEPRLRLIGKVNNKPVDIDLDPPSIGDAAIWDEMLEQQGLSPYWDKRQGALKVTFDETHDAERESMTRSMSVDKPQLSAFGAFDPLSLTDIKLAARSEQDAVQWALHRLQSRIQNYATNQNMKVWAESAQLPFSEFDIKLPNREELALAAWISDTSVRTSHTWHLVAGRDWRL